MGQCFVPDCRHYSESHTCRFYRFPNAKKDQSLRLKWVGLIRRADKEPTAASRVCSCHFRNGEKANLPEIFESNKKHISTVEPPPKKRKTKPTEPSPSQKSTCDNIKCHPSSSLSRPSPVPSSAYLHDTNNTDRVPQTDRRIQTQQDLQRFAEWEKRRKQVMVIRPYPAALYHIEETGIDGIKMEVDHVKIEADDASTSTVDADEGDLSQEDDDVHALDATQRLHETESYDFKVKQEPGGDRGKEQLGDEERALCGQDMTLGKGTSSDELHPEIVREHQHVKDSSGSDSSVIKVPSQLFTENDDCGALDFSKKTPVKLDSENTSESPPRKSVCYICLMDFDEEMHLTIHMKVTHPPGKPVACPTCGKVYPHRYQLKNHIKSHTDDKPYLCEMCGKSFQRPRLLYNHVQKVHTERKYVCETCGKKFTSRQYLKTHREIHLSVMFTCECGRAYKQCSNLKTHRRRCLVISTDSHVNRDFKE